MYSCEGVCGNGLTGSRSLDVHPLTHAICTLFSRDLHVICLLIGSDASRSDAGSHQLPAATVGIWQQGEGATCDTSGASQQQHSLLLQPSSSFLLSLTIASHPRPVDFTLSPPHRMAFPQESQDANYDDYALEATQLSQPIRASQRNTQPENSQVEPRRKYCE